MKINLLLIIIFLSIVIYAEINYETGIVGATRLNGEGCICHNLNFNDSVNVWVEGPDSIFIGDTSSYKIYLSGGSAVKGGFNVATMFGTLESVDNTSYINSKELTHTSPLEFIGDTIFWNFNYIASDSEGVDTIYSVANSTNGDGNPQVGDKWNFGENFVVNILEEIVPVELTSFVAVQIEHNIVLSWSTAGETNNAGFKVQHAIGTDSFSEIGFVKGRGSSSENNTYSFTEIVTISGFYRFRLKQVDYDGNFKYSDIINLDVVVTDFSLKQNFPNPFNPSTSIQYTISSKQFVTLNVYDVLGNEITTLVNENKPAGNYEVEFLNTDKLTSGIYVYELKAGSFTESKKMLLIK